MASGGSSALACHLSRAGGMCRDLKTSVVEEAGGEKSLHPVDKRKLVVRTKGMLPGIPQDSETRIHYHAWPNWRLSHDSFFFLKLKGEVLRRRKLSAHQSAIGRQKTIASLQRTK